MGVISTNLAEYVDISIYQTDFVADLMSLGPMARLYIFRDLNSEQTLPSFRKREGATRIELSSSWTTSRCSTNGPMLLVKNNYLMKMPVSNSISKISFFIIFKLAHHAVLPNLLNKYVF